MNQIQALKFYKILKISSTELEKSSSAFKKNLHSGFDGKLFVSWVKKFVKLTLVKRDLSFQYKKNDIPNLDLKQNYSYSGWKNLSNWRKWNTVCSGKKNDIPNWLALARISARFGAWEIAYQQSSTGKSYFWLEFWHLLRNVRIMAKRCG